MQAQTVARRVRIVQKRIARWHSFAHPAGMNRQVFIHAGAHRTGTSSFQMCLNENRGALSRLGFDLAYPGRDGVPGGRLRLRLPRPRHGEKRIAEFAGEVRNHLSKLSPDLDRGLILSEENIPGPMRHFHDGQFFPASVNRLKTLAAALDAPPPHVLFVVRPYAELFVSAFRKRAEDNAVSPFAELAPRFLSIDRGWPDLIADIQAHLQPIRLTVVPYADRGESRALLARLVPDLDVDALVEPDMSVNQSATDAALEALQHRYRAGEDLERHQWKAVIATHAGETGSRGFAEFRQADRDCLDDRYRSDLERLADMSGVTFP